jgi:hypothetical protein
VFTASFHFFRFHFYQNWLSFKTHWKQPKTVIIVKVWPLAILCAKKIAAAPLLRVFLVWVWDLFVFLQSWKVKKKDLLQWLKFLVAINPVELRKGIESQTMMYCMLFSTQRIRNCTLNSSQRSSSRIEIYYLLIFYKEEKVVYNLLSL